MGSSFSPRGARKAREPEATSSFPIFFPTLSLHPPAGACQGMFRALFAEAARRMDSLKPRDPAGTKVGGGGGVGVALLFVFLCGAAVRDCMGLAWSVARALQFVPKLWQRELPIYLVMLVYTGH